MTREWFVMESAFNAGLTDEENEETRIRCGANKRKEIKRKEKYGKSNIY